MKKLRPACWVFNVPKMQGFFIVKGDCLTFINLLKSSKVQDTLVGFLVKNIITLVVSFIFCSWSSVKRQGNKVAHDFAHLQPYRLSRSVCNCDVPDSVLDRASIDMYDYINSNIV